MKFWEKHSFDNWYAKNILYKFLKISIGVLEYGNYIIMRMISCVCDISTIKQFTYRIFEMVYTCIDTRISSYAEW